MKILVDTSVLIDYIRQSNNPNCSFTNLVRQNYELLISDITLAELFAGKYVWESKIKMRQLKLIINHLPHLSTNDNIAIQAGKIRAFHHIALLDSLIASTAIIHKLPIATLNIKDFSHIPHLKIAKL